MTEPIPLPLAEASRRLRRPAKASEPPVAPPSDGQSAGHGVVQSPKKSGASRTAADRQSSAPAGLLTIQHVADHCAVSYWTAREWVDTGKLPALRLPGRLIRIRPAALQQFLARCEP